MSILAGSKGTWRYPGKGCKSRMVARHFGSDVVLTITPDDGFCLASLIVDDTDVTRHVEESIS